MYPLVNLVSVFASITHMRIAVSGQIICLDIIDGVVVGGWVALIESGHRIEKIYLSTLRLGEIEIQLSVNRPDVVVAGQSSIIRCGFVLHGMKPNIRVGDFVNIRVVAGGVEASKTVLLNENQNLLQDFSTLEIERSRSILDVDLKDLAQRYSDILLLKIIMIRLRRGMRGASHEYPFIGYSYLEYENDFELYSYMIENFGESLSKVFKHNTRWLLSINDTFSDCGIARVQDVSMSFSSILVLERFFQTYKLHRSQPSNWDPEYTDTQIVYWGSMPTNRLELDDVYDIFLTRLINHASSSENWVHLQLLLNILLEPTSLVGTVIKASDYFAPRLSKYVDIVENKLKSVWENTGSNAIAKRL